ncbi:MAG: pilin [Patescibacteria group bacterium]
MKKILSICVFVIIFLFLLYPVIVFAGCCRNGNICTDHPYVEGNNDQNNCTSGGGEWFDGSCRTTTGCPQSGLPLIPRDQSATPIGTVYPPSNQIIKLNVPLGNKATIDLKNEPLATYLAIWYGFIIGSVGILATVMIMWGGFKWLTSRGNATNISNAKENIWSAIIGLVLAFLSYTILYLINPALTVIKTPALTADLSGFIGTQQQGTPSPTAPGPEDHLDETQLNDGRTNLINSWQNLGVSFLSSNHIFIPPNVRVDGLSTDIMAAAQILQGGCNCNLKITSGYRPESAGSQHQLGRAVDFSRENEQFNTFMQNTVIGNSQPAFYYRSQPAYRVVYGGINMVVINETINGVWHVDVRR